MELRARDVVVRRAVRGQAEPWVLRVAEWYLPAGAQRCLVGRSGAGKTTLLHVLSGLLRPDEGSVTLGEHGLYAVPEAKRDALRARHIGLVFQQIHLLPSLTSLENVALAASIAGAARAAAREQAMELLTAVGLADRCHALPSELSVGQQQRVAVARALVCRPAVVLADEPTAHLDDVAGDAVIGLLLDLGRDRGASVVCVTHDVAVRERFDQVQPLSEVLS